MKEYKYKNHSGGTTTMFDKKGKGYVLLKGATVTISEKITNLEMYNISCEQIQTIEQKPQLKKDKKIKGDDIK